MLADRLRLPVQRCMAETSSTDFKDWQIYFTQKLNQHDKLDHYLAQLAAEMRRSWVKKPKSVKPEDFLLQFERKTDKPADEPLSEIQKQDYLAKSKAFFGALLGGSVRKPPPKRKKPVVTKKKESGK